MNINSGRLKLVGFAFVFSAGFAGRWFNLYFINHNPIAKFSMAEAVDERLIG